MEIDTRNIKEKYKWWEHQDIVDDLDAGRSKFIPIFFNLDGDFNLSSGIRNSNWFNCDQVVIIGRKRWDRRGAVGTHNYMNVTHFPEVDSFFDYIASIRPLLDEELNVFAAEITDDAVSLTSFQWPDGYVYVMFGEEGAGISEDVLARCNNTIYIPGRGSVRSLNVATTSGIFMYDYHMKMGYL